MWRIKIALLYLIVAVLGTAWYGTPGFLVGCVITGWEPFGWTTLHWIAGGVGFVVSYAWIRLTQRWITDKLDASMDRAVDWATR